MEVNPLQNTEPSAGNQQANGEGQGKESPEVRLAAQTFNALLRKVQEAATENASSGA